MDYHTRRLNSDTEPESTPDSPPQNQPQAQPPTPPIPTPTPPTSQITPRPSMPLPSPARDKEERNWGMASHLSALSGFVVPFGNIFGPLLVWLLKKDEYSFVNEQGKESLNFQLSLLLYAAIGILPSLLLFLLPLFVLLGFGVIYTIVGGVAANEGKSYRYPLTIRFIQ